MDLKIFISENPGAKKVKGDPHEAVLRWANRNGYVRLLKSYRGTLYYNDSILKDALMWAEKEALSNDN